jgi:hypothetical protein
VAVHSKAREGTVKAKVLRFGAAITVTIRVPHVARPTPARLALPQQVRDETGSGEIGVTCLSDVAAFASGLKTKEGLARTRRLSEAG